MWRTSRPGFRLPHALFGALLLLAVVPVAVAGLVASSQLQQTVHDQTLRTLRVAADLAQTAVLEFLVYLKGRTLDVAGDWYINDALASTTLGRDLDRYLAINRGYLPESEELFV